MPNIIIGEQDYVSDAGLTDIDYKYEYPNGLDIRPGSKLHIKIKNEVMKRARESYSTMNRRYGSWREIDRTLTCYIPTTQKEEDVKDKDSRKPISIVFPYSYAILETLLSYLCMAFFQDPMFRYEGVSPEDTIGAIMMEKVIDVHCNKSKVQLALHTFFRDSIAYGFGVGSAGWDVRRGLKTVSREDGFFDRLQRWVGRGTFDKVSEEAILFEGNMLSNVDPYRYLPDPAVGIHRIQSGEFVGWVDKDNYFNLLDREKNDADLFNVKYLKNLVNKKSSIYGDGQSSREEKVGGPMVQKDSATTKRVDIIYMYINLIPKDWELGGGEYPEKWLFALGNDSVVVTAKTLGLDHGMYPLVVGAPDFDGYSPTPLSRIEVLYGLQGALDWMFNCYDDKTEVLTSRGWVPFPNTIEGDKVATVDPKTLEFWFEEPKQWFKYDYDGYMVNFKSSRMDICVTPNHEMFVKRRYERIGQSDGWQLKPAAFLGDTEYKTVGNLSWRGERNPTPIKLWGKAPQRERGQKRRYRDVEIPSDLMAAFLGWFLSEGSISRAANSGTYIVAIKQSKGENYKQLDSIFDALPFHTTRNYDLKKHACSWQISSKQLYRWLKDNCYKGGTTGEFKRVPDFVKGWDEFALGLFFDCAMRGDGYWMPSHPSLGKYGSKSKRLVDDMQEIALRLGYFSHIYEGKTPKGYPFYTLNISRNATLPTIALGNCFKSLYKGKVYCAENSTHLLVTRRQGKVAVQGNSHVANVRKAINDMLIVDPYLLNIADLKDPGPGKLVRMRRPAWGRGVDNAIKQLDVKDITRANIADAGFIVNFMNKIGGADESMQGALRKGGPERLTKGEFQGTRASAISRLERIARVVSLQAMQDIGYMFASHVQQLMSEDLYVKTSGRWQETLMKEFNVQPGRMKVTPYDILVDYDVKVRDGSIPGNNFSEAWVSLFSNMIKVPELFKMFDMTRIFTHIARNLGAKNVEEFKRVNVEVQPDETVAREEEKGNVVALEGV